MTEFFNKTIFTVFGAGISLFECILFVLSVAILIYLYRYGLKFFTPRIKLNRRVSEQNKARLRVILLWLLFSTIALIIILLFNIDYDLISKDEYTFSISLIIKALFFWQLAQLIDWVINNLFLDYFYPREDKSLKSGLINPLLVIPSPRKTVQYLFFLLVIIYIVKNFGLDFGYETTIQKKDVEFTISKVFESVLVIVIAQLVVWALTHLVLYKVYERRDIDVGSQFAINQLIKYLIYTFAILTSLTVIGINASLLVGGAAALLVGLGLGLQQTFNDFVSGIVLLFERSVAIGDVLEFDDTIGEVQKIGLRSSIVHTRQNVSMVVPNHKFVNENIINWTHYDDSIRFTVNVGVAYSSDTELVSRLLLESVKDNTSVLPAPKPFVRLNDFGSSSLDFTLYYYSKDYMTIEDVKSRIRLKINKLFVENNVSIPFPQRVVRVLKDD